MLVEPRFRHPQNGGFVMALVGCWLGCCLIPFCVDDCKDTTHTCVNCQRVIGQKKLIS
jgi:hypothetical protein